VADNPIFVVEIIILVGVWVNAVVNILIYTRKKK
jgi:hypothetical protein